MADYKETTIAGNSFNRCRLIEIRNPHQQAPSVVFTEERITTIPDRVLKDQPDAPITVEYDPTAIISVYDPITLQPTGATATMQDVYGLLFSSYFHFATQRDTAVSAAIEQAALDAAAAQAALEAAANPPPP